MKRLLAALAVCAVLGVAFLLSTEPEPAPALSHATPNSSGNSEAATTLVAAPSDERVASGRTRIFAASGSKLTSAEIAALPRKLTLAGTLVLEESDGSETRDVSGRFQVTTRVGEFADGHVVQIREGRWSVQFELQPDGTYRSPDGSSNDASLRGATLSILDLQTYDLYGPVSELKQVDSLAFGQHSLELRVRRLHSLQIRVEDARTAAPLENLTLLKAGGQLTDDLRHPGYRSKYHIIVEEAESPVRLTEQQRQDNSQSASYLVGSPGYAWTSVAMDFSSDGERLVKLERGGLLEVMFAAAPPVPHLRLQLRAGERSQAVAAFAIEDARPIQFEGLAADTYELEVDSGGLFGGTQRIWARGTARVVAGARAEVTLEWIPETPTPYAPLAGTVVVPEEWKLGEFLLRARRVGGPGEPSTQPYELYSSDMQRIAGDTYAFSYPSLRVGEYRLDLPAVQYATELHLPAEGLSDFEFRVPPPVEIRVFLRDDQLGGPADVYGLQWSCVNQHGQALFPPMVFSPRGYEGTIRTPEEEFFRLVVPRTQIAITLLQSTTRRYRAPDEHIDARLETEFTLQLRSTCDAHITLLDGETKVPWPRGASRIAAQLDGTASATYSAGPGGIGLAQTETPGRYTIEIPKIRGFEPHGEVEVEIRRGETREVKVQLVRE